MHRNIQTPAARANDPSTSHAAADRMTKSGWRGAQRHLTAYLLGKKPGATSQELASLAEGLQPELRQLAEYVLGRPIVTDEQKEAAEMNRFQVARRLPELETAEIVERGPARACEIKGTKAITWWPVSKEVRHDG